MYSCWMLSITEQKPGLSSCGCKGGKEKGREGGTEEGAMRKVGQKDARYRQDEREGQEGMADLQKLQEDLGNTR